MIPVIGLTMDTVSAREGRCPTTFGCHYLTWAYAAAIRSSGGLPLAIPHGPPDEVPRLLSVLDGLLVTGGSDMDPTAFGRPRHPATTGADPSKTAFELALTRGADAVDLPFLGICLGLQVLNVARGGSLHQHLPEERPGAVDHVRPGDERRSFVHEVTVIEGTRLAAICGAPRLAVNSIHHQGVDDLGEDLVVAARSDDGLVEALEDPRRSFLMAVQWHPEDLVDRPAHGRIFANFVEACRGNR